MADSDDWAESDITDPILDEHGDVRRRFAALWRVRTSGDAGGLALAAAWQPLANLLEGHARAASKVAAPDSHKDGGDEVPRETHV